MPMATAHKKHHKASGGEIDAAETKTTLKNSVKPFAKTKVDDGEHHDKAHGTGEVKEGKPGGYKHGGKAHHKHGGKAKHHKHGGVADCYKTGGTIEGNEGKFENTKVDDGDHHDSAHGTGGVRMGNAGGYKRGGRMHHKADGGTIDKKLTRTTVEGGDWENRPANTSKPGKSNTKTGEVKESNAGGYRHGGHASKKAYATGGNVVDDGKAVKYPHHFVSQPVANSLQSGTFKRGGKVKRHADGGMASGDSGMGASQDLVKMPTSAYENQLKPYMREIPVAAQQKAYKDWRASETADNEAFVNAMKSLPKDIYEKIKGVFSPSSSTPPSGSVTKTEKSVTVAPKRRGGKVR